MTCLRASRFVLPLVSLCAAFTTLASAEDQALPPAAETAKAALDSSPRHGEYAFIPMPGTEDKLKAWVVYPERADKAPVAVVIHEIYGLTEWLESVADALAKEGFIAVASAIAPAVASALHHATGTPLHALPFSLA